ncbi:MAG: acetyltransferase domain protein [Ramlibacter sp.]|nr:acetyltransferase domain protein [Ramlibacter sp.]
MISTRPALADDALAVFEGYVATARTPGLLVSQPEEIALAAVQADIAGCTGEGGCFLVATRGGQVVGHACLARMGLRAVRHIYRLTSVVHPGHTGQGVGRQLLQALHAWAEANPQCRKIELLVRAGNAPAVRLYEAMGYRHEGRLAQRVQDAGGVMHDDLAMAFFFPR